MVGPPGPQEPDAVRPLRVLTVDGGGMRGVYTAAFLHSFGQLVAETRSTGPLDIGKGFDLIVGTSTGAIIGCAAAVGVPMQKVVTLYSEHGPKIFPLRLRGDLRILPQLLTRPAALRRGDAALRAALSGVLGEVTFKQLHQERGIALSIPAVEMSQEKAWVFKTGHWGGVRDNDVRLVDACMASSAAPIYRSLASLPTTDGLGGERVFADGGLWANNPVLCGLLDAVKMGGIRPIQIFSAGSIPRPNGEQIPRKRLARGLWGWKFGGRAAELSIAAQEFAFDDMARLFAGAFSDMGRPVSVIRFPVGKLQPSLMRHLDIDNATPAAVSALISQARADALIAKSAYDDPHNATGRLIRSAFDSMPEFSETHDA